MEACKTSDSGVRDGRVGEGKEGEKRVREESWGRKVKDILTPPPFPTS